MKFSVRAVAFVAAALVTVPVAACSSDAEDPLPYVQVSYGDHADNYGHLYLPEGDGPFPVVVMMHGGGWLEEHDLSYFEPLAQELVDEGLAVWTVEYRRVGGEGGWPTTLADVDDATEALATTVQEAAGGRLDLDDVHLAGHSAGGHLAAWVAGRHTLDDDAPGAQPEIVPVSATIMAGVTDLSLAATAGHDGFVRDLLGGMPDEQPERYLVASPIEHLPTGVAVTAVHGTADDTVDPVQSSNYVDAALELGDPAVLVPVDGAGHGDFGNVHSEAWARAKEIIVEQANS